MKLDCYTHIFPVDFFHRMEVVENKAPIKRWLNIPMLYDVDARLRIMDTFGEYQQILTLSAPPIEAMSGPDVTPASPGWRMMAWQRWSRSTPTGSRPLSRRCR